MDAAVWFSMYTFSEVAIIVLLYKLRDIFIDPDTINAFLNLNHESDDADDDLLAAMDV